tara:strand:- start:755 stop:1162 length:408 start_codon:yes stop_codon:yes gene_type:complete
MNIPENVLNPSIYKKARKIADETYKRDGAYKNMFLVKKYQELGGKYKGKKTNKLSQWRQEKWVSVADYLKGKNVPCGEDKIGNNACRPTKRINKSTPITIQEVIKKHGRDAVEKAVNKKIKNMSLRLNWNTLKFS